MTKNQCKGCGVMVKNNTTVCPQCSHRIIPFNFKAEIERALLDKEAAVVSLARVNLFRLYAELYIKDIDDTEKVSLDELRELSKEFHLTA